ncbi:MAG: hypothetical protein ACOYM3_28630, partial [Terrimicrobiaceae bacterium]
ACTMRNGYLNRLWLKWLVCAIAVVAVSGNVINAQASSSEVEAHNSAGGSFANDGTPNGGPAGGPGNPGGPGGPGDPGSGTAPQPTPTPETFKVAFDVQASGKEVKQDCAVCHWLEVHIDGKKLAFGETATLKKGKSYEVTVKDNPQTRGSPPQGSTPPHDSNQKFTVWPIAVDGQTIEASDDKKVIFAQKDQVLEYLIDNSREMLAENKDWYGGILQKKAILLPVEVKEAWSDQMLGVKVNWMPNGTGWAEKPYILMSVRADGKAYAKAKVAIDGPPELRNKILWRIAKGNGSGGYTPMSGDSSYDTSGEVVTIIRDFPDDDPNQNYILVGGYDQDGNGYLSTSEANIIPTCKHKPPGQNAQSQTLPFTFKVVSKPKYDESISGAGGISNVAATWSAAGLSNAGDLLAKFASGANPTFDGPSAGYESLDRLGTDNEGVKRGMSHPVGVLFQPVAERGQTIRAYYSSPTNFAADFLTSRAFQIELTAFLNGKAELLKTLATPAPGTSGTFGMSGDLNFRNDITVASPRADLNMLFAMGRCKYELTIAVDFEDRGNVVVVTDVRVSGRAVDLYDFDYDDDLLGLGFVTKAARVQSGYNTAGNGRRVITTEIDFEEESVPGFGWQVSN